jgi:hypothetical protein
MFKILCRLDSRVNLHEIKTGYPFFDSYSKEGYLLEYSHELFVAFGAAMGISLAG